MHHSSHHQVSLLYISLAHNKIHRVSASFASETPEIVARENILETSSVAPTIPGDVVNDMQGGGEACQGKRAARSTFNFSLLFHISLAGWPPSPRSPRSTFDRNRNRGLSSAGGQARGPQGWAGQLGWGVLTSETDFDIIIGPLVLRFWPVAVRT